MYWLWDKLNITSIMQDMLEKPYSKAYNRQNEFTKEYKKKLDEWKKRKMPFNIGKITLYSLMKRSDGK
jgi:hypothetical protein